MHQYFLIHNKYKIFLFESDILFKTEAQCLKQYEKCVCTNHVACTISIISQVWLELELYGLTGQVSPVELIRVLCAFGAKIQSVDKSGTIVHKKSYKPVIYFVEVSQRETADLNKMMLGHYYTTSRLNADQQFPKFCKLLERDYGFPVGHFQVELSKLFYMGYTMFSIVYGRRLVLAQNDLNNNTLRGTGNEETLFYVGLVDAA